ncbi:YihY/virulence factor BrkB family protein [Nigerium massiliense]|uniref:YihY/virulence factor BrkB family protein n=1 Tax=Nigerium massiliense TaxID=1522317 RepID=UPI00069328D8|nr:YihY/virulence factor BrkB family protein [Nigerium massiliense]
MTSSGSFADGLNEQREATVQRAETAPHPDDQRKPRYVRQISRSSWWYAIRRTAFGFMVSLGMDAAGALTYYSVLSLFPALLALVATLGLVGQGRATTEWIVRFLSRYAPPDVVDLLRGPVENLTNASGAGIVFVIAVLVAVWSASGYVAAFGRVANDVYGVVEGRPLWRVIPTNVFLMVLTLVFGAFFMLTVLTSTEVVRYLGTAIGLAQQTQDIWNAIKWPILGLGAICYTSLIYYATPNVRQPRFRWISTGSSLALVIMAAAVFLFTQYVIRFGRFNAMYGVVGSVTVLLLVLWLANVALVLGVRLDAELERVRELQAGIAAEERLQLPPRDERMAIATGRTQQRFVEQGRAIRERYAHIDYAAENASPSDPPEPGPEADAGSCDGGSGASRA